MDKTADMRAALKCTIHPIASLENYTFVVVCSRYRGQWLLSRHKKRDTWETQGGHIEPGETPLRAAARELYEESGAVDFDIEPLFDYAAGDIAPGNPEKYATGVVFFARIRTLSPLPESEMAEVRTFDTLPQNVTYPHITPHLFAEARARGLFTDRPHE